MDAAAQLDSSDGSDPLNCQSCGYDLTGLLTDEWGGVDCPECGRLAIALKMQREEGEQRRESLAKRWLILGVLQGIFAAISIHVFVISTRNLGSTATQITGAGMWLIVPITLVLSGVCGGFWIRYNTPGARRWDYVLSVVAFMVLWLPVTFFATILLFLIPF